MFPLLLVCRQKYGLLYEKTFQSTRRIVTYPQLSVQLYTVREAMQADLTGTLKRVADIGFTQVEPYNFTAFEGLGDALAAAGLSAPTTHAHFVGEDEATLNELFAAAKELGITTVIDPFVAPEKWQDEKSIARTAASLNAASTIAARHGVKVGYHNHAHELKTDFAGITGIEVLASELSAEVILEIDTYWVAVGGKDPVALLKKLGNQVTAIHVKDGPATEETKDQVAVGSGSLPIADIVGAAPQALRVIELDDSRGDRFDAITDSYGFLTKENLV
jgi:sugar phosphate isomerase/epimerase